MNPGSLRLAAPLQVGAGRVRMREGGGGLGWHLQRAQGLARILELEHAVVRGGRLRCPDGGAVADVAAEIIGRVDG